MPPPKLVTAVRTYEELDGAQGREVFFRPQRYRAPDLLPVRGEVLVSHGGVSTVCPVHDVSQNGVAFEWPAGKPALEVGKHLPEVTVRFDGSGVQALSSTGVAILDYEQPSAVRPATCAGPKRAAEPSDHADQVVRGEVGPARTAPGTPG